jgi:glutamyl-tRNA synthetase
MEWFDLSGIGRSPARLDFKKLENLCGQHIAVMDDAALLHELDGYRAAAGLPVLSPGQREGLARALYALKDRAKTFPELLEKAHFILTERPIVQDDAAEAQLDSVSRGILKDLTPQLRNAHWTKESLEAILSAEAAALGIGFGKMAGPLRAAIAGRTVTPSVYDMMLIIGRDETVARLEDASA